MAARTATQLTHTTPVSLPGTPGTAADTAGAGNDTFPNGGQSFLLMNNTAGSSATVTVSVTQNVDGLAVSGRQFTVPANTIQLVKLGPTNVYGTTTTVTCSADTVRLAAYSL